MSKKTPKFEALVVNAIRRLQASQGSTPSEIAGYLSKEYDVSGPEVRRQIQLTIRRGINYGILQKSKRGYTTCDRNIPEPLMEPSNLEDCYGFRKRRGKCGKSSRRSKRGKSSHQRHKKALKRQGCGKSSCGRCRALGRRSRKLAKLPRTQATEKKKRKERNETPTQQQQQQQPQSQQTPPNTGGPNRRFNSNSPIRKDEK